MRFHEDVMFKDVSHEYGHVILRLMNLGGRIIKFHPTEYSVIDPKMYKPDIIIEVEDKIYIIEFQSTYVDISDKKRFRFYTAIIDFLRNKSNKEIEVHVLSTVEPTQVKMYKVSKDARFPIYIHSLKDYDGDQKLNNIRYKISNNKNIIDEELVELSLVPFMSSEMNLSKQIIATVNTMADLDCTDSDIFGFISGIELLVADKFLKNETDRISITNKLGGKMKIVEEYADRRVDKAVRKKDEVIVRQKSELEEKDKELEASKKEIAELKALLKSK